MIDHRLKPAAVVLALTAATLSLSSMDKDKPAVSEPVTYTGISDASGAVSIGTNFLAVADDEDNCLRIYRRDEGGPPMKNISLARGLGLDPKHPELDLEAAARIDDGTRIVDGVTNKTRPLIERTFRGVWVKP